MDKIETGEFTVLNVDRRRLRSFQEWVIILALLTNFAGVVWWSSRVNTELMDARAVNAQLITITDKIVDKQSLQDVNIAIIKAKLNIGQ